MGTGYFTENLAFVNTEKAEHGNEICCCDVNLKQWELQLKIRPWNTAIMTFHFFSVMLILNSFLVFWRQKIHLYMYLYVLINIYILYKWNLQSCCEKWPQHMQFSITEGNHGLSVAKTRGFFMTYGRPPTAISQPGCAIPLPQTSDSLFNKTQSLSLLSGAAKRDCKSGLPSRPAVGKYILSNKKLWGKR